MTREDAIKEINKVFVPAFANYIITALTEGATVSDKEPNTWNLDDAREDFMYDVYNELDFLPTNEEANRIIDIFDRVTSSIEQAPRWIPVTERLPEEGQFIIVSYPYDASDCSRKRVMTAWYHKEYGFTCGITDAWMPLPQPYKAESEGKE